MTSIDTAQDRLDSGTVRAMGINVQPIAGLEPAINDLRRRTAEFVNAEILPHERDLWASMRDEVCKAAGAGRRGFI